MFAKLHGGHRPAARTAGRHRSEDLNVALVHDYLNQRGGAERVFSEIARAYPGAPIFTALFNSRETGDLFEGRRIRTSWLQRLPGHDRYFRFLAPLYPAAFEAFDLTAYDVVVSSTTAWAKGVRVRPGATHVCYINTVSRFAFAYDRYVGGLGASALARPIVERLVEWDRRAASRPTAFVANSHNVAARVKTYYGRGSYVLHCPVDLDRFRLGSGDGGYMAVVSRLLPYKRIDLAIEACREAGIRLFVAGTGPARAQLAAAARGSTTTMLGYVGERERADLIGGARAVIVPGEEDFGLVPLEAAACGRPTIAYGGGGARETVVEGVTGTLFPEPTAASLRAALEAFDDGAYDPLAMRAHAEKFSPQRFIEKLRAIVEDVRRGTSIPQ